MERSKNKFAQVALHNYRETQTTARVNERERERNSRLRLNPSPLSLCVSDVHAHLCLYTDTRACCDNRDPSAHPYRFLFQKKKKKTFLIRDSRHGMSHVAHRVVQERKASHKCTLQQWKHPPLTIPPIHQLCHFNSEKKRYDKPRSRYFQSPQRKTRTKPKKKRKPAAEKVPMK